MKRLLALLLGCSLLFSAALAEWSPSAMYEAAAVLMLRGDYAAAAEAFAALSGYGDAPQMSIYCRGMSLAAGGDYARAEKAFAQLGGFKDAAVWVIACRGMAAQTEGERLMAAGTLQGYTDGPALLEAAAEAFDQIDYLPEMAERAEYCRALASQAVLDVAARSFDQVGQAAYGLCEVWCGGRYGVVNTRGELVVPCEWDRIVLYENTVVVWQGDRRGAYSHTGEVILACEYEVINQVGSVLLVAREGKCGVLDLAGEVIVPCEWMSCQPYGETYLLLKRTDAQGQTVTQWVLVDAAAALPEGLRPTQMLSEDLVLIRNALNDCIFRLSTGQMISGEKVMPFGDGFIVLEDYDTEAFTWYDAELNVLTPPEGAFPGLNAGFWAFVKEDGTWYLTDLQGRTVLSGENADELDVREFDGGFSALTMPEDGGATCLLMDTSGEIVLTADAVEAVYGGRYAEIEADGSRQLVDLTTGVRTVLPGSVRYIGEGLFYAMPGGDQYVLLNAAQGWQSETMYDKLSAAAQDGLLMVSRDDLYGFVNLEGEEVVPCEYERFDWHGSLCVAEQTVDGERVYSIINARGQVLPCESKPQVYGTMYRWRNGDWLYNASGEAVYEVDRADGWTAGGGYVFAIEDGLLTIYDETGSCVY